MARKKKNDTTDQFIAQNLIEIEKPANNKAGIALILAVILVVLVSAGVLVYLNRDKFDWNFKWPWQETEEPILLGDKKDKDKDKEKMELLIPEFYSSTVYATEHIQMSVSDLKHTDKGFEFTINVKAIGMYDVGLEVDKVLLDKYAFDTILSIDQVPRNGIEGTVRINQTDLDRYNMVGFSKMRIFYYINNLMTGDKTLFYYDPVVIYKIKYDNEAKGLIEMYNFEKSVLSYYRTTTDKDNTYIYFHMRNDQNTRKYVSIKKLYINGEMYEYPDLNVLVYNTSQQIFYLTIPKREVKKVEDFAVTFFITVKAPVEHNDATYITTEYKKTI